jgi:hypothetical protein
VTAGVYHRDSAPATVGGAISAGVGNPALSSTGKASKSGYGYFPPPPAELRHHALRRATCPLRPISTRRLVADIGRSAYLLTGQRQPGSHLARRTLTVS